MIRRMGVAALMNSFRKRKTPAQHPPGRGRKRPDSIGQGLAFSRNPAQPEDGNNLLASSLFAVFRLIGRGSSTAATHLGVGNHEISLLYQGHAFWQLDVASVQNGTAFQSGKVNFD